MRFLLLAGIAACCVIDPLRSSDAQALMGAYNAVPINLASGQFAPLQADQHGYLAVDCLVGCASASGASGAVTQGTPAAVGNAWPVFLTQGGTVLSGANGVPVTDTQNGTPIPAAILASGGAGTLGWLSSIANTLATGTIVVKSSSTIATTDTNDGSAPSGAVLAAGGSGTLGWLGTIANTLASGTIAVRSGSALPTTDTVDGAAPSSVTIASGGSGMLGWLGTIAGELAGTLSVQQAAAGTVVDASVSIGTTSTAAVTAATGVRYRATLTNTSTTAANTVWCRADGGAAAPNVGVPLAPNGGGYEWVFPLAGAKPAAAINCIATSAASTVAMEYVQ